MGVYSLASDDNASRVGRCLLRMLRLSLRLSEPLNTCKAQPNCQNQKVVLKPESRKGLIEHPNSTR